MIKSHTPGERIPHRGAYPNPAHRKTVKVELEIMLDSVPGWGDRIEDHINLIFLHNLYVQSATVIPDDDGVRVSEDGLSSSIQL